MTTEETKNIVTGFYADIDAGRREEAFARMAPNFEFEIMAQPPLGGVYDRESLGRFYKEVMAPAMAVPLRIKIIGMVAEGNRVAVETEGRCFNFRNEHYNNRYHTLLVVQDGKIIKIREYLDSALLQKFVDL